MATASELNLPENTTTAVIESLIDDMLQQFYSAGQDPELDAKIERVFQQRNYGAPFQPRRHVTPSMLMGFPGHGKTTAFRVAGQRVAQLLGMRLVIDPRPGYTITRDDIVMITEHLGGLAHAGPIMGIPSAVTESVKDEAGHEREVKHTVSLSPRRFAMLRNARAGIVIFDDLSNAALAVQNICLSLFEDKAYNELDLGKRTYVGATGNLGALDGTHTAGKISAAIRTRTKVQLIADTMQDWQQRTYKEYPGEQADGGVVQFLASYPDYFHKPDPKGYSGYCAPRSWTKLTAEVAEAMRIVRHIQTQDIPNEAAIASVLGRVAVASDATIGREAGNRLRLFLQARIIGAAPLAHQAMKDGETPKEPFMKHLGKGVSSEQHEFAYQYIATLAEVASARVAEAATSHDEDAVKQTYERFAQALLTACDYGLTEQHAQVALHNIAFRLASLDVGIAHFVHGRVSFMGAEKGPQSDNHLRTFAMAFRRVLETRPEWKKGDFYRHVFIPEMSGDNALNDCDYQSKIDSADLALDEDSDCAPS